MSNSRQSGARQRALKSAVAGCAIVTAFGPAFAEEPVDPDQIIVTASPLGRTVQETIVGTSIIDNEELQRRLENSVGETLRREPGISSTFFGPGASRPVIRGLGGDRIRVLDNAIGSIDASVASPDHAVSVDPATAQSVEIVRGPATLLYGNSAAGGVVNILSGRIPTSAPEDGVDGAVRAGLSTVDSGYEFSGAFDAALGEIGGAAIVFHGDGFYRDAQDYDIPGFAESDRLIALEEAEEEAEGPEMHDEEEEEEVFGVAENSFLETKGGSAGLSLIFENGFVGISGTAMDTLYGVPGGHGHEEGEEEGEEGHDEEEEEEGGVSIDLRQRRLDLDSEYRGDFLLFEKAKLRLGYADYEHVEFEPSGEAGTVFANEGFEGRLELVDKPKDLFGGELNGAVGLQYRGRDFSAIGEEAFVPPTTSDQFGVFALKELSVGQWRFEVGGRYENTSHEVEETGVARDFDSFSVSGGVGVTPRDSIFLGVAGFRTERAPSTEELFSNGPHLATDQFEIGDPTLEEEVSTGVEATARYTTDRFAFAINGFYTSYDDFIFEARTGEEEDGLPVFQFQAEDARFVGFEAQAKAELFQFAGVDVHADAAVDYVRAEFDRDADDNIPRIPPLSGLFGVDAKSEIADLRVEVEYAAAQRRTSLLELPTDSFAMLHTYLTLRPFSPDKNVSVILSATNLTNEDARLHTSFLKDVAPLPGRNFRMVVRAAF